MKPYERREKQAYPYYKLAVWDAVSLTWRDGKKTFASADDAAASHRQLGGKGRFRVSRVTETGRQDLEPFEV